MNNIITDIETQLNEDVIKKIESSISCPRCRKNIKCLRRKVSTTNKNKYKGVCYHCVNEYLLHKTNKFGTDKRISGKETPIKKYHKDKVKLWLSKVVDLLENNMILLKAANLSKHARRKVFLSTYKEHSMYEKSNKVQNTTTVDQMFDSQENAEVGLTETPAKLEARKRSITYDDYIKYNVIKNFDDTKRKQYYDNSTYSLRTSDSELTIPSVDSHHKRSASLHHKLYILKKDICDEKHPNLYENKYTDATKPSQAIEKGKIKSVCVDSNIIDSKQVEKDQSKNKISTLRKSFSAEPLQSAIADLEDNFSYFFPKEERLKKPIRRHKSSSEIIKEVLEMLNKRAKLEKINKEKEWKQKSVGQDHKKQAYIEPVRSAVYKQKVALQPATTKVDETEKAYKQKNIYIQEKTSIQSKSTKSDINTKSYISDKDSTKSVKKDISTSTGKNQKGNDDKSDRFDLEKEKKTKEKVEKEQRLKSDKEKKVKEMAEKEERLKLDKEIKLKEKADKEERLKLDKEKKLKEKAEKEERLKLDKEKMLKENIEKGELSKLDKQKKQKERVEKEDPKLDKNTKIKEQFKKDEQTKTEQDKKLKIKDDKEGLKKEKSDEMPKDKEHMNQKEEKVTKPTSKKDKNEIKPDIDTTKLLAQAKAKEEEIKKKKQQEEENKKMKQLAEQKIKDKVNNSTKQDQPKNTEEKEEKSPEEKSPKEPTKTKEVNISKIKIRKRSPDDLILRLVRIKKAQDKKRKKKPTCFSELDVSHAALKAHKGHKFKNLKSCTICQDSDLQLDIDNIIYNDTNYIKTETNMIIGEKILKNRLPCSEKPKKDNAFEPILFKSQFHDESSLTVIETNKQMNDPIKQTEQEVSKGVIRYALSDRSFIEKGWTMLPTEKVVRKMNVYRMRPAHPEFDWFEHNKNKKIIDYDTGEKLAEFDDTGKGRWFYRNGRKALDYYDAEEINAQQRIIIYSNGEPDERGRGRPYTILATFDYLGNGIVFDHTGKIRLKYNQTEGVVLDRNIGPVSHWKWHTLNDPPVLQQVMIDTQMAHKDPDILKLGGSTDDKSRNDNEEMLAIEFDNFIKEKSKKLSQKFKPFQIKMKALKINEHFSLKVLDQATVYLIFRDGSTNLKLNIGMILDHKEIVDTDTAEVGVVSNSLERFPARTDSLAGLQQSVAHSQRIEKARVERDRRIRSTQSCTSADKLTAGASKPLRQQFRTTLSSINTTCNCKCRKPSTKYIYYDTRLI